MNGMDAGQKEAREFLDKEDGGKTKVFEVRWVKQVIWYVAASSQEEAKQAAEDISGDLDLYFEDPDVFVSKDLVASAEIMAKRFHDKIKAPEPDSGVFDGEILSINEYVAQRIWQLICERSDEVLACSACGYEDSIDRFNCHPGKPQHGYIPKMACPECDKFIGWKSLVECNVVSKADE